MTSARLARAVGVAALAAVLTAVAEAALAAPRVTAFAAASLRDGFGAVAAAFERSTGVEVRTAYASSGTLARQIARGAPADVYLSADPRWMDYLAQRDAIAPDSRFDLLTNRLVLVARADSDASLAIAPGFPLARALGNGRLAIGHPAHVAAGHYARAALEALGVWQAISPRLARAANVRAALALVVRAGAPLGIVYRSDAVASGGVRIVDTFPEDSHPSIVYPAARVRRADKAAAGRLLAFLRGDEARRLFTRSGFGVAE